MTEDIKHWTTQRKSALVIEIIQGKTTASQANRSYDPRPSEIEEQVEDGLVEDGLVEDGLKGMENGLRAHPLDVEEQTGSVFTTTGALIRPLP